MIKQEIVEGLRVALSRGYTLEKAMMSFYNAGYKKEDIEESARALYSHPSQPLSHPHKEIPQELKKPIEQAKPLKSITEAVEKTEKKVESKSAEIQKVSKYEESAKPKKGRLVTILLVILLMILIGGLIGIILFKDQLIRFFTSLF